MFIQNKALPFSVSSYFFSCHEWDKYEFEKMERKSECNML